MRVLLIDNNDSFTYNIVQLLKQSLCNEIDVIKSDMLKFKDIEKADKIIISPGYGLPKEHKGISMLLNNFSAKKSILGICLGHQAICEYFGAQLYNLDIVYHGQANKIHTDNRAALYKNIEQDFNVGLYHSWAVKEESINKEIIKVTSKSDNNIVMSVQHKTLDIHGVQFHPESYISENGLEIINNFLSL